MLAVVLQGPVAGHGPVTPSRFTSLEMLSSLLKLVEPERLTEVASAVGLACLLARTGTLPSCNLGTFD